MKLFLEGDLQIHSTKSQYDNSSIHYEARKNYIDWVLNNPKLNNEDVTYISLGDLYEHSVPDPRSVQLGVYYMSNLKCRLKIIIAGNHDYDRNKKSYSIDPLAEIKGVTIVKEFKKLTFANSKIAILPYFYDFVYKDKGSMKEYYESLEGNYDFILHHFEDETQDFGSGKGIKLKLKGERIGGHIHVGGKGYLESPIPNKTSEMLEKRNVILLDTSTKQKELVELPDFLRFETIDYPNDIDNFNTNTYYTLSEVTDKEIALNHYKEKYPNIHIKEVRKKSLRTFSDSEDEEKSVRTIKELWNDYKNNNKLDSNVAKIIENQLHF